MIQHILYSVLRNRCPKCHQTNVFKTSNAFNLKQFDKMNESCSCCGETYEKEPGYFFGAMYVSYALMAGWFIITWAIDSFFIKSETWQYLTFVIISIVLFMPLTFRISRLLWLNFFIRYDKTKTTCTKPANPSS
ncbi:MAG TPA: DUF983 domain-containing protein [Bacteroidia bacterium]|nr:DUF983 domain-containing protein [Bacteroidia bacterium]